MLIKNLSKGENMVSPVQKYNYIDGVGAIPCNRPNKKGAINHARTGFELVGFDLSSLK